MHMNFFFIFVVYAYIVAHDIILETILKPYPFNKVENLQHSGGDMRCWARDRKVICHLCLTGLSKVWWCLELSVVR